MYTDEQYWNREELFEAVWSTPMRKLAQRYGISDVGLAKVCRKLSIPLPGLGYWAKIAAGHQVRKATLTPVMEEVRLRKPDLRPDLPKPAKSFSEQDRAQVGRIERCEWQVFLKRGSLSHPLIVQARETLRHEHADERQILWTSNPCLDIRVSKDSLDRAMRIMAAIICGLEAEGFSVAVGARQREQTTARIHGQELKFGLIEKVNRVELASPPKGGVLEGVLTFGGKPVTFKPSGELFLEVWHVSDLGPRHWSDGKTRRIEELIPQVVTGLIRLALAKRAKGEQQEAERLEQQRRAEAHARLQQQIKDEQARVRELRRVAADWHRTRQLRAFISAARDAAAQNGQAVEPGTSFGEWLGWAEEQADRLDPFKESPPSIIDRKSVAVAEYSTHYPYRKLDPPFRFPKPIWKTKP